MDHLIDLQAGTAHTTHHLILDQISETTMGTQARNSQNRQNFNRDNNRNRGYQQNTRFEQRNNSFQNRYLQQPRQK